jgi:hypothetical protein
LARSGYAVRCGADDQVVRAVKRAGPVLKYRRRVVSMLACGVVSVAGLITCAVAVTGLVHARPAVRDFGAQLPPAATFGDTSSPTVPGRGRSSPTRPPVPQFVPSPPTRIQIPALKVLAPVDSVATVNGRLGVPEDPMTVGWWVGAAEPGSLSGSVVLDGHVDSATLGLGAFFHLTALRAGNLITLTTAHGDQVNYQVTGRRSYAKSAGLPPYLFTTSGPPRLVLITCGGQFDHDTLSYDDNIVILARPTNT